MEKGMSPLMIAMAISRNKKLQKRIGRLKRAGYALCALGAVGCVYMGLEINFGFRMPYGPASVLCFAFICVMSIGGAFLSYAERARSDDLQT